MNAEERAALTLMIFSAAMMVIYYPQEEKGVLWFASVGFFVLNAIVFLRGGDKQ